MARMEANEISEFSNQMKEAGEAGESLTNISLAISILAVLVAMVTVLGHRTHTEAVLSQARASDTWNEYQAKRIRSYETGIAMDLLGLQPSADRGAVEKKLEDYKTHVARWSDELKEEQELAKSFEEEVERAEKKARRYDSGEALLQIAVVLCSITLFTRRRLYFFLGLSVGAAGILFASSALLVR